MYLRTKLGQIKSLTLFDSASGLYHINIDLAILDIKVSCARGMSDELTRHMSDLGIWMISERWEASDAAQSGIDGGDTDGAI